MQRFLLVEDVADYLDYGVGLVFYLCFPNAASDEGYVLGLTSLKAD